MSFASNFVSNFSTDYGPSNLFSDELVGNNSYRNFYSSTNHYDETTRLFSDELVGNNFSFRPPVSYLTSRYSPIVDDFIFDSNFPIDDLEQTKFSQPIVSHRTIEPTENLLKNEQNFQTNLLQTLNDQQTEENGLIRRYVPTPWHESPRVEKKSSFSSPRPHIERKNSASNQNSVNPQPTTNNQEKNTKKLDKSTVQIHTWFNDENDQQNENEQKTTQKLPPIKESSTQNKTNKGKEDNAYQLAFKMRHDSYFDSLFQGSFTSRPTGNLSYEQSFLGRGKAPIRHIYKAKVSTLLPGTTRKFIPTAAIPSNSNNSMAMKKQNSTDTTSSRPTNSDSSSRDNRQKNPEERYREALQRFRSDRAEQQQRETVESTAKRLNYGKYVKQSSKDLLLQNVIKPLPWSDFVYYKKGNVYALSQEEKRELHQLSKSYGERIRHRNLGINPGNQSERDENPTRISHPNDGTTDDEQRKQRESSASSSSCSSASTVDDQKEKIRYQSQEETTGDDENSFYELEGKARSSSISKTGETSTVTDRTSNSK